MTEEPTAQPARRYRLGADVGGTFTDLVLADSSSGNVTTLKVPTRRQDIAAGVVAGIRQLLDREGVAGADVGVFVHGTTLATNTVIERSGATVGLLVTAGTRDMLELGRLRLGDPTNFLSDKPVPLVRRRRVAEVSGRLLASGAEWAPLDEAEVVAATRRLLDAGAEAVAICFLHSYVNPDHERRARDAIREAFPGLSVCISSEIWPQQREYERAVVTVVNTLLGERIRAYFQELAAGIEGLGMSRRFLCTRSNGGVMSSEDAAEHPVQLLLSGPAAGVVGALYLGEQAGDRHLMTLDIGGTSADIAVIDGQIPYSSEGRVGDYPVLVPTVDVTAIGAGGGSIAWIDQAGLLKVGPASAGSEPGPASYGRGGEHATVTDAYLVTGILAADRFLGGTMPLQHATAEAALGALGAQLGLSAVEAAWAVLQVTTAAMYARVLPFLAARGVASQELSLFAYGGAGPTHAFLLARELGMRRVIVPSSPGALCALGCLVGDLRADFIQSVSLRCEDAALDQVHAILEGLAERGRAWVAEQHIDVAEVVAVRSADMRYVGQSFDINVPLPESGDLSEMTAAFERIYESTFHHHNAGAPAEIMNLRVQIVGVTSKPQDLKPAPPPGAQRTAVTARRVYLDGAWVEAPVYDRYALAPGTAFQGPAIVEQYDTTILVPDGYRVDVDAWWRLVGTRLENDA